MRDCTGLVLPSVISTTDHNVLLGPRQKASFALGPEQFAELAAASAGNARPLR